LSERQKIGEKIFAAETEALKPFGFFAISHSAVASIRTESLKKLHDKVVKFCPHFVTTAPTMRYFMLPSINTGCCVECFPDFLPLLQDDDSGCDLCGIKGKEYVEISIPLGYGSLAANLGANCCAEIFTKTE